MQGVSHYWIQVFIYLLCFCILLSSNDQTDLKKQLRVKFSIFHNSTNFVQVSLLEMLQFRHVPELFLLGQESEEPQVDSSDARILHRGKTLRFVYTLYYTSSLYTSPSAIRNNNARLFRRPHLARTCATLRGRFGINSSRRDTSRSIQGSVICRCRPFWRETRWKALRRRRSTAPSARTCTPGWRCTHPGWRRSSCRAQGATRRRTAMTSIS